MGKWEINGKLVALVSNFISQLSSLVTAAEHQQGAAGVLDYNRCSSVSH